MTIETPVRRVQRVRHALQRREVQVLRVEDISPHFRRIIFAGDALADFVSASFDDHVKLLLPDVAGEPVRRDYTPRRFDAAARELALEFALHGEGPAALWAAQAAPGQRVAIGGPRGSFVIDINHDWHLLVGDESALPAIARRLEELPPGSRAIVRVQLRDSADQRPLPTQAALDLQWLPDTPALLAAVRALVLPPGEGYAWVAGEAQAVARLRSVLVDEKGHGRHAIRAAAYWKHGSAAHHENLDEAV